MSYFKIEILENIILYFKIENFLDLNFKITQVYFFLFRGTWLFRKKPPQTYISCTGYMKCACLLNTSCNSSR